MSLVGFRANNHPQQVTRNGADDEIDDRGTRAATIRLLPTDLEPLMTDVECRNCGHWERHHNDRVCTLMLPATIAEPLTDVQCDCPGFAPVPPPSPADIDALDKLRETASQGPWELDPVALCASNDSGDILFDYRDVVLVRDDPGGVAECTADGELIVAAVNALPELLAEVRRGRALREAVNRLAEQWERLGAYGPTAVASGQRDGLRQAAARLRAALDGNQPC